MGKKINTHKDYTLDGIEYPSVTNILKILNKESLQGWANYLGFKHQKLEDVLNESASIGSYVHYLAQCYICKKDYIVKDLNNRKRIMEVRNRFLSLQRFLDKNVMEANFMEKSFISSKMGYAGTMDFVGMLNDKLTLLDFKTSKNFYDSMFIQLAGYDLLLKENNIEVEQYAILLIHQNECILKIMTYDEIKPYQKVFMSLLGLYESLRGINYV